MQGQIGRATVVFSYPFRIFFLSTALSGLVLTPLWLYLLLGDSTLHPIPHWHSHEMLTAFVSSAMAGFLLTAVCAWTNTRPVVGWPLAGVWLLWVCGRILMLAGNTSLVAATVDLAFLPAVAVLVAKPVIATRNWRQLPVLAALSLLWLCDLAFHISGDMQWLRTAIVLVGGIILVIGGRITPVFSRNWLVQQGQQSQAETVTSHTWLDVLTVLGVLLLAAAEARIGLPTSLIAPIALFASATASVRLLFWRGWLVRTEPLLLVLHVGVLWICVAFLLRALAALGFVTDIVWIHAMGAGAFGTMILGVMARVALGHTGRPLSVPTGIPLAFLLIFSAGLLRVTAGLGWLDWRVGIYASALCWTLAFLLFCWRFVPILLSPRIEEEKG